MLLDAVVLAYKDSLPTATLLVPVVFVVNALNPIATLLFPVVTASQASSPTDVFSKASPTSILPLLNVATPATPIVTPVPTVS